jgi:excisionase family DNA binding protein
MDSAVISTEGMTPKVDTEKLVTVSEAARLLKIGRMGVHQAIQRGRLAAIKLGGVLFINRSDLSKYQKSKSVGGRPKKKK